MQQFDFSKFHYLVMDASFFLRPLDDALCAELSKHCDPGKMPFLCASSTFHSEFRQYARLLEACSDQLSIYQENLQKLKDHKVSLYIHSYTDYGNADNTPRHDTWSLLDHLLRMNSGPVGPNILLLTGNELLLRRVVLSGLPISIYDFRGETLFTPEELAKQKEEYELDLREDPIELKTGKSFNHNAELVLSDAPEGGNQVRLIYDLRGNDDIITEAYTGTEGEFFSVVGKPELVAKVYGKDEVRPFSRQLAQNIQNMHRFHTLGLFPWAMLPVELLYDANGNVAGYLMKKLDSSCWTLQEYSRFNNTADSLHANSDTPYAETLRIGLSILREIAYMSNFDILPLDFGRGNFCPDKDSGYVFLLDTCSVCFQQFFSSKRDPGLMPQYTDLTEEITSKLTLIDLYMELVHLFLLSLMTTGSDLSPMKQDQGSPIINFLLKGARERALYDTLVPDNLRQLYWSLFCDPDDQISPFSVEVLMEEMSYALEVVEQTKPTYGSLLESKGHQGDAYPSGEREQILPCTIGPDIPVPPPAKEPSAVYERPAYLRAKIPPAIHTFGPLPEYGPMPACPGQAESKPLPAVGTGGKQPLVRPGTIMVFLLVMALIFSTDCLCFASTDMGFTLAEFWAARMETLRDLWAGLTGHLFGWLSIPAELPTVFLP